MNPPTSKDFVEVLLLFTQSSSNLIQSSQGSARCGPTITVCFNTTTHRTSTTYSVVSSNSLLNIVNDALDKHVGRGRACSQCGGCSDSSRRAVAMARPYANVVFYIFMYGIPKGLNTDQIPKRINNSEGHVLFDRRRTCRRTRRRWSVSNATRQAAHQPPSLMTAWVCTRRPRRRGTSRYSSRRWKPARIRRCSARQ